MKASLSELEFNELYHLMRKAFLGEHEVTQAFHAMSEHLLSGRGPIYHRLNAFSEFYGKRFLLEKIVKQFKEWPLGSFDRVVDVGCGTGWLGHRLAGTYLVGCLRVDKRYSPEMGETKFMGETWDLIDIEDAAGLNKLKTHLREDDLIVMCDALHCLKDQGRILDALSPWNVLIIEYTGMAMSHMDSYTAQTIAYGSEGVDSDVLRGRVTYRAKIGSHDMFYLRRSRP